MAHSFKNKIIVITGSSGGIGRKMTEHFKRLGAVVCSFDKNLSNYFIGDLSKKEDLESFASKVIFDYGQVDIIINNAAPIMKGIKDASYEEIINAFQVGAAAPFYLAKLFKEYLAENSVIINISSTRDRMSQPNTESYTMAKGAIKALTHGLAISLAGKTRVNSISPGWINTLDTELNQADSLQHPVQRIGNADDIIHLIEFLCSDKASFINGENIVIDGGISRLMVYNGDNGWKFTPNL